jgi:hypothetical protein
MFCIGVKLALSHYGRTHMWVFENSLLRRCLEIRERKRQEAGKRCIIRSFKYYDYKINKDATLRACSKHGR